MRRCEEVGIGEGGVRDATDGVDGRDERLGVVLLAVQSEVYVSWT